MADHLKDKGSKWQTGVAGATSGLVSRFVVAPFDVVKIRQQLQSRPGGDKPSIKWRRSFDMAHKVVANEGFRALWKGNIPAELMYMVYSGVQFTTYRATADLIRPYFAPDDGGFSDGKTSNALAETKITWVAGTVGGLAGTATSYPLDLMRTRFAAQGNHKIYRHFWTALGQIRREEGIRQGLFRGFAPTLVTAGPGMGIYFLIYETLRPADARAGDGKKARLSDGKDDVDAAPRSGWMPQLPGGFDKFLAGSAAMLVSKTAVFPFDLVRKNLQVQGPHRSEYAYKDIPVYKGTRSTLGRILAENGWRGLYRGLPITLAKHVPSSGVTIWVYEQTLRRLMKLDPPSEQAL